MKLRGCSPGYKCPGLLVIATLLKHRSCLEREELVIVTKYDFFHKNIHFWRFIWCMLSKKTIITFFISIEYLEMSGLTVGHLFLFLYSTVQFKLIYSICLCTRYMYKSGKFNLLQVTHYSHIQRPASHICVRSTETQGRQDTSTNLPSREAGASARMFAVFFLALKVVAARNTGTYGTI